MADQGYSDGRRAARRRNSTAADDAAAVAVAAAEDFAARGKMLTNLSTIPPEDRTEEQSMNSSKPPGTCKRWKPSHTRSFAAWLAFGSTTNWGAWRSCAL